MIGELNQFCRNIINNYFGQLIDQQIRKSTVIILKTDVESPQSLWSKKKSAIINIIYKLAHNINHIDGFKPGLGLTRYRYHWRNHEIILPLFRGVYKEKVIFSRKEVQNTWYVSDPDVSDSEKCEMYGANADRHIFLKNVDYIMIIRIHKIRGNKPRDQKRRLQKEQNEEEKREREEGDGWFRI